MRLIIFFLVLSTFPVSALADVDSVWAYAFGSEGFDRNWHHTFVKESHSDNMVFLREEFSANDGLINHLTSIDPDGEVIWTRQIEGAGTNFNIQSILQTTEGNYSLVGGSPLNGAECDLIRLKVNNQGETISQFSILNAPTDHGYTQLDLNESGTLLAGYKGTGEDWELDLDFWLIRLDSDGLEEFSRTYGEDGRDEICRSVCMASDGGFLLAGIAGNEGYLVRITDQGDTMWTTQCGGYETVVFNSVIALEDGAFLVAGTVQQDDNTDGCVGLIGSDGLIKEFVLFGGENNDRIGQMIKTSDGSFVFAGTTCSFGEENGDFWLVKINQNLQEQWSKTFGGERDEICRSVIQQSDGSYVLTGETSSFGAGDNDVWVVKTSPDPDSYRTFTIDLRQGWSLVASPVPMLRRSLSDIWGDVNEDYHLLMMKDQGGRFYVPEHNFDAIHEWDFRQGFAVKLTEDDTLLVTSHIVSDQTPIPLRAGWNIVSYLPEEEISAEVALNDLGNDLIIIKDGDGNFYDYGSLFSNLPSLKQGSGYLIRVTTARDLIWNTRQIESNPEPKHDTRMPTHFPLTWPTGSDMSLLIRNGESVRKEIHTEIGVFASSGMQCGSARLGEATMTGLAVRGDDPTTVKVEGAIEGEALNFLLWNGSVEQPIDLKFEQGEARFFQNRLSIANVGNESPIPNKTSVRSSYPNPFNGTIHLSYQVNNSAYHSVSIIDEGGRVVQMIRDGYISAGSYDLEWNAADFSSGTYFIRVSQGTTEVVSPLRLVK